MANWSVLKASVAKAIKTNGNQEITGQILQNALSSIISNLGENATFAGIAIPTINPGVPDGPVFYFAFQSGVYYNFNGIRIEKVDNVKILKWDGSNWDSIDTGLPNNTKVTELVTEISNELLSEVDKKVQELSDKVDNQKEEVDAARDKAIEAINSEEQSAITNFNAQRVTPEMLSESTLELINSRGGGIITNLADDEDLYSTDGDTHVLKFKNKDYIPENFSGLGRVYLRKNVQSNNNILTQDMINKTNTRYIIQYDYDLNGETIVIPENCILEFQGGSLNNGVIEYNNTIVKDVKYNNISISKLGKLKNLYIIPEFFGAVGDGITDDTDAIQYAINYCQEYKKILYLPNSYYITSTLYITGTIKIIGTNTNYREISTEQNYNLIADYNLESLIDIGNSSANSLFSVYISKISSKSNISLDNSKSCNNFIYYTSTNSGPQWPIIITDCHIEQYGYISNKGGFFTVDSTLSYCLAFLHIDRNSCYYCNALINFAYNGSISSYCPGIYIIDNYIQRCKNGIIARGRKTIKIEGNNFDLVENPIQINNGGILCNLILMNNYFEHNNQYIDYKIATILGAVLTFIGNHISNASIPPTINLTSCYIDKIDNELSFNILYSFSRCRFNIPINMKYVADQYAIYENATIDGSKINGIYSIISGATLIDGDINVFGANFKKYLQVEAGSNCFYGKVENTTGNNVFCITLIPDENMDSLYFSDSKGTHPISSPVSSLKANTAYSILLNVKSNTLTQEHLIRSTVSFKIVSIAYLGESITESYPVMYTGIPNTPKGGGENNKPSNPNLYDVFYQAGIKRLEIWNGEKWVDERGQTPIQWSYAAIQDGEKAGEGNFYYHPSYKQIILWNGLAWVNPDGSERIIKYGPVGTRPTNKAPIGFCYFDTTINKPIWWTGTKWVYADGEDA